MKKPLRLRLLSDLHLEFMGDEWLSFIDDLSEQKEEPDVLILAGDIASGAMIEEVLSAFADRFAQVIFVAGNHEYYSSSPTKTEDALRCAVLVSSNLHWLDASAVEIDGQRFLGGTLWFPDPDSEESKWALNDFHLIMNFEPWVYEQNSKTRRFLEANVKPADVVVTHHLPSYACVHPKYEGSPLNKFFVSSCDNQQRPSEALVFRAHAREFQRFLRV
jgi:predicted phosphohydrolase